MGINLKFLLREDYYVACLVNADIPIYSFYTGGPKSITDTPYSQHNSSNSIITKDDVCTKCIRLSHDQFISKRLSHSNVIIYTAR